MKIGGVNGTPQVTPYQNNKKIEETDKKTEVTSQDTVQISQASRELQSLKNKMAEVPDVRMDKVTAVQAQLSTYQVDMHALTNNIMKEIMSGQNLKGI